MPKPSLPALLVALICPCVGVGCGRHPPGAMPDERPRQVTGAAGDRFDVTHVVVCWLRTPGDVDAGKALIAQTYAFAEIPGVKLVSAGWRLDTPRPRGSPAAVTDAPFDVLIVMTFEDLDALRAYQVDPRHKRAVAEVLQPHVARYVVYDAATREE